MDIGFEQQENLLYNDYFRDAKLWYLSYELTLSLIIEHSQSIDTEYCASLKQKWREVVLCTEENMMVNNKQLGYVSYTPFVHNLFLIYCIAVI